MFSIVSYVFSVRYPITIEKHNSNEQCLSISNNLRLPIVFTVSVPSVCPDNHLYVLVSVFRFHPISFFAKLINTYNLP